MMTYITGVIKQGAVFYLCLCVLSFGVMCTFPSASEARIIEKSTASSHALTQVEVTTWDVEDVALMHMRAGANVCESVEGCEECFWLIVLNISFCLVFY